MLIRTLHANTHHQQCTWIYYIFIMLIISVLSNSSKKCFKISILSLNWLFLWPGLEHWSVQLIDMGAYFGPLLWSRQGEVALSLWHVKLLWPPDGFGICTVYKTCLWILHTMSGLNGWSFMLCDNPYSCLNVLKENIKYVRILNSI